MSSKRKLHNRCGKSSRLSGSTLQLLERISAGMGKSQQLKRKQEAEMMRNLFRGKEVKHG